MFRKKPEASLKKYYPLAFEAGLIVTLLALILVMNVRFPTVQALEQPEYVRAEGPAIVLPPVTKDRPKLVPPPPVPHVPVRIPDDSPIEIEPLEFDEFDQEIELEIPPHPEEVKVEVDHDLLKDIEVLPRMIGGEDVFRESIEYPIRARTFGIEGIVEVEFTVNKRGKVLDPVIVRGIGGGCDEAVLKAIKLQRYTPGVKEGELAEFRIKETVQFILLRM